MASKVLTHLWPALTFLLSALASPIPSPDPVSSPQGFALPIIKDVRRNLSRRAPFAAALVEEQAQYLIRLRIGSLNQPFSVSVDTGSSKTWVPDLDVCEGGKDCTGDYFEEGESASCRLNVVGGLDVTYGDLTVVNGDTFMNTLMINGVTIPIADLGLARTVDTVMSDIIGVMGLGFDNSVPTSYPSIICNMLAKGVIGIAVYSLWLGSDRRTGSIYFGGIEPGGLFGALVISDVTKDGGEYKFLKVAYQHLAIQTPDDQDPVKIPIGAQQPAATAVVLDSGTSDLYLPIDQWLFLVMKVGAVDAGEQNTLIVDCRVQDWDGGVDFTFFGFMVQVNFSEWVEENDDGTCYFKVQPSLTNNILGGNFLRQIFVVYDLAAKRIAMSHAV